MIESNEISAGIDRLSGVMISAVEFKSLRIDKRIIELGPEHIPNLPTIIIIILIAIIQQDMAETS